MRISTILPAGVVIGGLLFLLMSATTSVSTVTATESCSPGFWKTHEAAWAATPYSPDTLVGDVFHQADSGLEDDTLLEALKYGGGPGVVGAEKILLRAAVAAILNANHPSVVGFPRTDLEIKNDVNHALDHDIRADILALAGDLDADNNAEPCPID